MFVYNRTTDFYNALILHLVTQSCPTLCDPIDCIAHQAPLSMGCSRQEYWSGLPCHSPALILRAIKRKNKLYSSYIFHTISRNDHTRKHSKVDGFGMWEQHYQGSCAAGWCRHIASVTQKKNKLGMCLLPMIQYSFSFLF